MNNKHIIKKGILYKKVKKERDEKDIKIFLVESFFVTLNGSKKKGT